MMSAEPTLPSATPQRDLRHSIRRLNVFVKTAEAALDQFNGRYRQSLFLSRGELTRAFLEWMQEFDAQRDLADRNRRDFSHFAAGMLLRSFIRHAPARPAPDGERSGRSGTGADGIIAFWPEGFFYFEFCITVLDRVLAEQRLERIHLAPAASELRAWHSFRENVVEDPNLAVPFLDLFLSGDPVWNFPTAARFRRELGEQLLGDRPVGTKLSASR